MAKTVSERLREYGREVGEHLSKVAKREESLQDAGAEVTRGTRKLVRTLLKRPTPENRKIAFHYLKKGVEQYNVQNYADAERYFRKSIAKDETFARAHYFLGNALFKKGLLTEAVGAWRRAMEADPGSEESGMAKEKLLKLGQGKEGIMESMREQSMQRWHANH
jgi:tetratricopeptide (TPR) repeat protein